MRRDAFFAAFELALVKEAQTGRKVGNDGGSLVRPGRKGCRGARLVVIFEESRQLFLVIESRGKVLADRQRHLIAEAVIEPLVIGVIETLLQHRPFEIPVRFGHEEKIRHDLSHAPDRVRPERWGSPSPGPLEDIR
jgi:hypothetical protein